MSGGERVSGTDLERAAHTDMLCPFLCSSSSHDYPNQQPDAKRTDSQVRPTTHSCPEYFPDLVRCYAKSIPLILAHCSGHGRNGRAAIL